MGIPKAKVAQKLAQISSQIEVIPVASHWSLSGDIGRSADRLQSSYRKLYRTPFCLSGRKISIQDGRHGMQPQHENFARAFLGTGQLRA